MKPWYEALFANYARKYDAESFTQGTLGECDFLEKEIGGDRSVRILDIDLALQVGKLGAAFVGELIADFAHFGFHHAHEQRFVR